MFCDRFGAQNIALADILFVDGTFSITPGLSAKAGKNRYPYGQVWVIHAGFDGRKKRDGQLLEAHEKRQWLTVPCAWIVMEEKHQNTGDYKAALNLLVEKAERDVEEGGWGMNFRERMKNKKIMMDFETAERNAFEEVFPTVELTGCAFHFVHALAKNIRTKGLWKLYRDNRQFKHYIRKVMMLMFLPATQVCHSLHLCADDLCCH